MSLIKSISGIRGTIGGEVGKGLTPVDTVRFVSSYALFIKQNAGKNRIKVVVGRDARLSGKMLEHLVIGALQGMGVDVINIGLATTPTVEVAVTAEKADGGIILTASHNPRQWNALKLLNNKGEFLNDAEGKQVLSIAENDAYLFAEVDDLGSCTEKDYTQYHIDEVLKLNLVDTKAIAAKGLKVAVDCVNSVGGIIIPKLLRALGVTEVIELYTNANGNFPHNPEPLKEHLGDICALVKSTGADLGFVVDPDVDRLAIIREDGEMFGEEYTLVSVADYVLSRTGKGNTVSNMSSTRALSDVTAQYGGSYSASAVGEVNVVTMMKSVNAIIGGEGNGGVIYPELHYGRDALVGIALFLSHLCQKGKTCSALRQEYPDYHMSKQKVVVPEGTNIDSILQTMKTRYANERVSDIDGVKIDFADSWVHLRRSNTEPIMRVYSEAKTPDAALSLANRIMDEIKSLL